MAGILESALALGSALTSAEGLELELVVLAGILIVVALFAPPGVVVEEADPGFTGGGGTVALIPLAEVLVAGVFGKFVTVAATFELRAGGVDRVFFLRMVLSKSSAFKATTLMFCVRFRSSAITFSSSPMNFVLIA